MCFQVRLILVLATAHLVANSVDCRAENNRRSKFLFRRKVPGGGGGLYGQVKKDDDSEEVQELRDYR